MPCTAPAGRPGARAVTWRAWRAAAGSRLTADGDRRPSSRRPSALTKVASPVWASPAVTEHCTGGRPGGAPGELGRTDCGGQGGARPGHRRRGLPHLPQAVTTRRAASGGPGGPGTPGGQGCLRLPPAPHLWAGAGLAVLEAAGRAIRSTVRPSHQTGPTGRAARTPNMAARDDETADSVPTNLPAPPEQPHLLHTCNTLPRTPAPHTPPGTPRPLCKLSVDIIRQPGCTLSTVTSPDHTPDWLILNHMSHQGQPTALHSPHLKAGGKLAGKAGVLGGRQ